jgi:hypothetical protein
LNENQIIKHISSEKSNLELINTKIIAVFILSRHKRGKKNNKTETGDTDPKNFISYYKVFIQFKPTDKNAKQGYKNIKSIMA